MDKIGKYLAVLTVIAAGWIVYVEITHSQKVREGVERANVVADSFTAIIDEQAGTIEERGRQAQGDGEVIARLSETASELADKLAASRARALTHARTVAVLRDSLRGFQSVPVADPVSGFLRYPISWRVDEDPENFFEISGGMLVAPDAAGIVDLDLRLAMSLDIVVSRAEDLSLRCDAVVGLPSVAHLSSLSCIDNLDDPIAPRADAFGVQMFQPPALTTGLIVGVLGLLAGVAISR